MHYSPWCKVSRGYSGISFKKNAPKWPDMQKPRH
jgi:hypothetical protein